MLEEPPSLSSNDPFQRDERAQEKKKLAKVVIFTSTFYGDDESSQVRSQLALEFLDNAEAVGVHTVVAEGGSTNQDFLRELRNKERFPNVSVIFPAETAMGSARREALRYAIEHNPDSYYLWSEPEKADLIKPESLEIMLDKLDEGADIVVPKRKNLDNYPHFQSWAEQRANKRANNMMNKTGEGPELDLWFGPKMFNRSGADEFLGYQSELDLWDATIIPVITANNSGKVVASAEVDFTYPEEQRIIEQDEEMSKKRLFQYGKILKEAKDPHWKDKG